MTACRSVAINLGRLQRILVPLVIKAARGEAANYYCIERAASVLTPADKRRFLAEMSQVAHLDNVAVSARWTPVKSRISG